MHSTLASTKRTINTRYFHIHRILSFKFAKKKFLLAIIETVVRRCWNSNCHRCIQQLLLLFLRWLMLLFVRASATGNRRKHGNELNGQETWMWFQPTTTHTQHLFMLITSLAFDGLECSNVCYCQNVACKRLFERNFYEFSPFCRGTETFNAISVCDAFFLFYFVLLHSAHFPFVHFNLEPFLFHFCFTLPFDFYL